MVCGLSSKNEGFTLVELIVVIAIVFVLIAVIFTAFIGGNTCSLYRYQPMRDVPAQCVRYYLK